MDGVTDVELKMDFGDRDVLGPKDIIVDVDELSLKIEFRTSEGFVTVMETNNLYGRIKPSETIWFVLCRFHWCIFPIGTQGFINLFNVY